MTFSKGKTIRTDQWLPELRVREALTADRQHRRILGADGAELMEQFCILIGANYTDLYMC